MKGMKKYEIHVGVTGSVVFEMEAASELDAEIAAQSLLDSGFDSWDEFDTDIVVAGITDSRTVRAHRRAFSA
tara:strand:- start:519 stop:734 length:216 start_codon:yes stop_codon:yes gene_type:complete